MMRELGSEKRLPFSPAARRNAQGQATDIEIHAREILYLRERLNGILADNTGKSIEQVARDTERDNFMSANEAKDYGLIDDVLSKRM